MFTDDYYSDFATDPNPFFTGKANVTPASRVQATAMVGPNLFCADVNEPAVDE